MGATTPTSARAPFDGPEYFTRTYVTYLQTRVGVPRQITITVFEDLLLPTQRDQTSVPPPSREI